MLFDQDSTGSPLQARQNPMIYSVILYLAIAIGIILAIWFIIKLIQAKHKTAEWIEAHKNTPTKASDVKRLSKLIGFSREEFTMMVKICKELKTPNIFHWYNDE